RHLSAGRNLSSMADRAGEFIETERKYDAEAGFALPDLAGLDQVAAVTGPQTYRLRAIYFDTTDFRLAAAKITPRRQQRPGPAGRTGGRLDRRAAPSPHRAARDDPPAPAPGRPGRRGARGGGRRPGGRLAAGPGWRRHAGVAGGIPLAGNRDRAGHRAAWAAGFG